MEIERELEFSLNCKCIFLPIFRRREISSLPLGIEKEIIDEDLPLLPLSLSLLFFEIKFDIETDIEAELSAHLII